MHIGVYLGSFDPPHLGHTWAIHRALEHCEAVMVAPAWKNPWKGPQTPFKDRLRMCELAFSDILGCLVEPLDGEVQSQYTHQFLSELLVKYGKGNTFSLIVGSDLDISKWEEGKWILESFPLIKIPRAGYEDCTLGIECSSTELRNRLKNKKNVDPFIGDRLKNYIYYNDLYTE